MIVKWDESYSVGVRQFDEQHKKLFSLIDELMEGLKSKQSREKMSRVLDELLNYTVTHFAAEEEAMLQTKFAGYDNHKKEHRELTAKVKDFHDRYLEGTALLTIELLGFIINWLKNHIGKTDKDYGPYLNEKGIR